MYGVGRSCICVCCSSVMEDGTPLRMRSRRWRQVFVYVVDVAIDDARSSLVVGVCVWLKQMCVCVCVCVCCSSMRVNRQSYVG